MTDEGRALSLSRYEREAGALDTVAVARALLGHHLACRAGEAWLSGRIVETEAYLGPHDLACHSSKGRTPRTEVMFGPWGHAYVFLVYGMHHCVNVVTGAGAAVLIRALEVSTARGGAGPGKLTRALGITREHDGLPLDRAPLMLWEGEPLAASRVGASARIGVDYAGPKWSRRKLRFFDKRSASVSQR